MNREFFAEVSDVFLAARSAGDSRASILEAKCGGRPELREAVERLLAEDGDRSDGFDDSAMVDGINLDAFQGIFTANGTPMSGPVPVESALPGAIGRFRVIRRLGEGGMGIVCEAEQDIPRRTVALKLLRTGVHSPGLARRFTHEAQVLARLQHPGIARIFEAGIAETPTGAQPYFAMELINGRPLLEHAAAAGLTVSERLALFLKICDAVEYAHQKGVIHRDLKPANILVDERGNPSILDFGVARVTDADLQVSTMQTHPGLLVGTLPYMSPEQVAGDPGGVDTRTDVYALGVILFQLLAGRLPYDTRSRPIPEVARIIREQEPTPLGSLDTIFRGDLEIIVSRALEKEPSRRYQSAAALASDISRHLRFEPIEARPPTRLYQLRKFARRNRQLVIGAAASIVLLILGLAGTSWGMIRATHQRNLANTKSGVASQKEAAAKREADKAMRLAAAMQRILEASNPRSEAGYSEGPVEVLVQAARDMAEELAAEPESEWTVRMALARSFQGLGSVEHRTWNLRIADTLAREHFAPGDSRVAESERALSRAYVDWVTAGSAPHVIKEAAAPHVNRVYESARREHGESDPTVISLLNDRSYLLAYMGNGESLAMHHELVAALRKIPAKDRPCPLAFALARLANCRAWALDEAGAREAAEESLSIAKNDPEPGDQVTMMRQMGLQDYLIEHGRIAEAIDVLRAHTDRAERDYGKYHPSSMMATESLAELYMRIGERAQAVACSAEVLAGQRALFGRWSQQAVYAAVRHAYFLSMINQIEQSRSIWKETLEILKAIPHTQGYQNEAWCGAQLSCGLRAYGTWSSECLRAEAHFAMYDALVGGIPSLALSDVQWEQFEFVLTRHDALGTPDLSGTVDQLWNIPAPMPGLYRLKLSVPVADRPCVIHDWVLVAPWHIRKWRSKYRDLTSPEQWAQRQTEAPDQEVEAATFTAIGWPPRDLGPHGSGYHFGLVAETRFELPAGTYEFAVAADDGAMMFLDGEKILDAWPRPGGTMGGTVDVKLTPGPHTFRLEYVQLGGLARLRLRIRPLSEQVE